MPTHDPITSSAGYLLLKAGFAVNEELSVFLEALDVTSRDVLVLSFVATTDGLSQAELSERLGIDPTIVVGLIDGLERRGLMQRIRDPRDRRRNMLRLTDDGLALREQGIAAMAALEDEVLAPLSAGERRTLRDLLHKTMAPRYPWLR